MSYVAATILVLAVALLLRAKLARSERSLPGAVAPQRGAAPDADTVEGLLARGRKIQAIKLYRRLHGVGLAEAKRAVEALAE